LNGPFRALEILKQLARLGGIMVGLWLMSMYIPGWPFSNLSYAG
jgi:hypothetical protein